MKDAKADIQKHLIILRNRISTNNNAVLCGAIFTAYVRSLFLYFMTAMKAVGMVTDHDMSQFEGYLLRKVLKLPNDIRSGVIKNTSNWSSRSTVQVVNELAAQTLVKCLPDPIPEVVNSILPPKAFFQREKKIIIQKPVHEMMMSVASSRTLVHYGHRHFCKEHKRVVDKSHINECSLLSGCGEITQYNDILKGGKSIA